MALNSRSAFLAMLAVAATGASLPHVVRAQGAKIRIGTSINDGYAEPYYLDDAGTFARAGFAADVTSLQSGAAVIAAIAGGTLDLGVADLIASANAFNHGVPIQLIAGCGVYTSVEPSVWIAVANGSSIRRASDLQGKMLAIPQLGGMAATIVTAWLGANGVEASKVKIVEVPQPAAGAAVIRGTVDAVLLGEPFYTAVKGEVRDIGHPFDAVAKQFFIAAWFAPRSWIEADRDRAKRVVGAIYETARWANTHRSETLSILARVGKMDMDAVRNMVRVQYATSLDGSQVQPVLDVAAKYKLLDRPVDAGSFIARL
jgi:NitT/TauT family transport system substrate-binding protein